MFGQGDGQAIGADNAPGFGQQGTGHSRIDLGFTPEHLFPADPGQASDAVLLAACDQGVDPGQVRFRESQDQRGVVFAGDRQLLRPLIDERITANIVMRLVCPGRGVVAGVDNATIGLARPFADIAGLVENRQTELVAGQFAGYGATDHTGADDHHIKHAIPPLFLPPDRQRIWL